MVKFIFIFLFLLLTSSSFAQDTITFVKIKDPKVEYKLPLNRYNIKIKPYYSKQFVARITGYTDSTLSYRQYKTNRATKDSIRNYYEDFYTRGKALKLTPKQIDSAKVYINDTIFEIRHSAEKEILFSNVKLLKINNHDRPEKQNLIKTVGTVAIVSGLASALISLSKKDDEDKSVSTTTWIVYGVALTSFVVYLNLETGHLCFKKWSVKNK